MPEIDSTYRQGSSLVPTADRSELLLDTALGATPMGLVDHPQFFTGFLARADVSAAGLLAVADVAASRYFDLAALRQRSLDPVVTASGDRLRFESFSACNGVHARLDLLADGIDSGDVRFGTTNVDVNQPLRNSLAGVSRDSLVHLSVGPDELRVATLDADHVERKVAMPDRWLRGFAETPEIARRMTHVVEIGGAQVPSFLAQLPRGAPGPSFHLVPSPGGLRRSTRPMPGSVHLAGTSRLSAGARVARFTQRLQVFGEESGASAWVFELPGARLTLLLSPEPFRGFSGEGALLSSLSGSDAGDLAARLGEFLAWEPVIDPVGLAGLTGLDAPAVGRGLSWLAVSGKIGFDLAEQSWFHRELPLELGRVERVNPRLVAAHALVDSGAVSREGERWVVHTGDHRQWVTPVVDGYLCTCLWWAQYRGQRGPCKHVLAVVVASAGVAASAEPTPNL